jgi:hypothetical protein
MTRDRTVQLDVSYRRDDFVAILEDVLPRVWGRIERVALYTLVALFWGLIIYVAVLGMAG